MLLGASSDGAVNNSVIVQPAPSDETPTEPAGQPDPPLDPRQEQPVVELIPPLVPPKPPSELDGLPLVILQSCHSLDGTVAEQVFSRGGVGLLGSVTNVHSASGSAFANAYCDGMLYRGLTAGEALRDARNYFICLARLGFVDRNVKALEIDGVMPTRKTIATGKYPISRPLFMFTNGYPKLGSTVHAFVTFHLTERGQEVIEAKGLVPVTNY